MSCYSYTKHLLVELRIWSLFPSLQYISAAKNVVFWVLIRLRPQWKLTRCFPELGIQYRELLLTRPSLTAAGPPTCSLNGTRWVPPKYRKLPFQNLAEECYWCLTRYRFKLDLTHFSPEERVDSTCCAVVHQHVFWPGKEKEVLF